jgi:hypothetical protein
LDDEHRVTGNHADRHERDKAGAVLIAHIPSRMFGDDVREIHPRLRQTA